MIAIRPAAASDAGAIALLAAELGYAADPESVIRILAARSGEAGHAVAIAEGGGAVLGWLQVEIRMLLATGPIAEVAGLVVTASARGTGAGTALLRWSERWAAERGAGEVRIRCNAIREATHEFYRRRGYRIAKTQLVFAKDLADPA